MTQAGVTTTTDYLGGFQYKNAVLQFFPHAEGYVNATEAGITMEIFTSNSSINYTFNYVFNYTDHLGNIRLSYSQDPSTNVLKVIEENHYYPFGLKHTGYNSDKMMLVKEASVLKIKPVPPLFKTSYDKKFNGKSWETDLSLNIYDFHARGYMPDIVRTFQHDPLAEKFYDLSPQSFLNNNPLRFTDPTGMASDDWIKWKTADGKQHITYDASVKTVDQAKTKGYTNIEQVFEQGIAYNSDNSEVVELGSEGNYRVNNGDRKDVDDESYRMTGGTLISENKGTLDAFGDFLPGALQDTGDKIAAGGLVLMGTAYFAPAGYLASKIGGTMSSIGTILELGNDAVEGKLTKLKFFTKVGLELLPGGIEYLGKSKFNEIENVIIDNLLNGVDRLNDLGEQNNSTPILKL